MKNSITQISRILLVVGCITLSLSVLIASVMPNVFYVYLTATASSFSHDILSPNMTAPYILAAVEIIVGAVGLLYGNKKTEN